MDIPIYRLTSSFATRHNLKAAAISVLLPIPLARFTQSNEWQRPFINNDLTLFLHCMLIHLYIWFAKDMNGSSQHLKCPVISRIFPFQHGVQALVDTSEDAVPAFNLTLASSSACQRSFSPRACSLRCHFADFPFYWLEEIQKWWWWSGRPSVHIRQNCEQHRRKCAPWVWLWSRWKWEA